MDVCVSVSVCVNMNQAEKLYGILCACMYMYVCMYVYMRIR